MSTLTAPIHNGTLNGKPLRFFKAPLSGPHLPWHAWDDMVACIGLPRSLRRHMQQSLKGEHAANIRTVATADGIVTIAPHWMAQGFLGSMIELRQAPASIEMDYARQAVEAWNAITGDLPPGANIDLMCAAFRNTNGIGGGGL